MTSYLDNGYDVMKYFAKFEKFIPHSMVIARFMTIGSQMLELDRGAFLPPPLPYKIGRQNTPYKLGLISMYHFKTSCELAGSFKIKMQMHKLLLVLTLFRSFS